MHEFASSKNRKKHDTKATRPASVSPLFAMGGGEPPTREEREAALRETIARLSDDADEPQTVAAALVAIRKDLRGSPDGPAAVVKVRQKRRLYSATHRRRRRDDGPLPWTSRVRDLPAVSPPRRAPRAAARHHTNPSLTARPIPSSCAPPASRDRVSRSRAFVAISLFRVVPVHAVSRVVAATPRRPTCRCPPASRTCSPCGTRTT